MIDQALPRYLIGEKRAIDKAVLGSINLESNSRHQRRHVSVVLFLGDAVLLLHGTRVRRFNLREGGERDALSVAEARYV